MIPHAYRPYKTLLIAVANVIKDDTYMALTEEQFVGIMMKDTGGSAFVPELKQMYSDLLHEAGIEKGNK